MTVRDDPVGSLPVPCDRPGARSDIVVGAMCKEGTDVQDHSLERVRPMRMLRASSELTYFDDGAVESSLIPESDESGRSQSVLTTLRLAAT